MNDLKVLHTVYNDTCFSNETEARWAVFFDELGVNWEYKAEVFELSKIGQYCPGFVINKNTLHEQWLEVRNFAQTFDEINVFHSKTNPSSGVFRSILEKLRAVAECRGADHMLVVGNSYGHPACYCSWTSGFDLTYCPRCGYHSFRHTTEGGAEVICHPCDHQTPGGGGNILPQEECHFKDGPVIAHKGFTGAEAVSDLRNTASIKKAAKISEKTTFEKVEVSGVLTYV